MSSGYVRPERWFDLAAGLMRDSTTVAAEIVEYERQADNVFQLITDRDFLPTLYQLKANGAITYTSPIVEGYRIGQLVHLNVQVTAGAAGTAASAVWLSLPPQFPARTTTNRLVGSFLLLDTSASTYYGGGGVLVDSGRAIAGIPHANASAIGSSAFTAALASGDVISYSVRYITTAVL